MTESPAYHEHVLNASDVCNSCHRVIRVERQDPARGGDTREFESHQERYRNHTEIDFGPADSVGDQKGVFCERCGTDSPYDRYWDDHTTDNQALATGFGWLFDTDGDADGLCRERELDDERVRDLIQHTIRTLEHKGVTIDRETLAGQTLRGRREGDHIDDCLGEAVKTAITRAVTQADRDDTRREAPA